jgi:PIN domain nuclease of toxin-antitoxin system
LGIQVEHAAVVSTLPFHHRDPFDRLLIAQAMVEGMPVISADAAFDTYPLKRLW